MKFILNKNMLYLIVEIVIVIILVFIYQNKKIVTTNTKYINNKIPSEFNDFKICHITDLQDSNFGNGQNKLIQIISNNKPDIIVVTGDLIDRNRYDLEQSMNFIEKAVKIAPVYYVSGNHEIATNDYENIRGKLLNSGVIVLDNETEYIEKNGEKIQIIGIHDYNYFNVNDDQETEKIIKMEINKLQDANCFQILLSHRPEIFESYVETEVDLVFSGHAHGGQIRLPFIGGLYSPGQGIFPKYDSGLYTKEQTSMYVSRGLGNSTFPLRIFNNPEVAFIILNNQ